MATTSSNPDQPKGKPLDDDNPHFERIRPPAALNNFPELNNGMAYCLPQNLLAEIDREVRGDKFEKEKWELESALTRACIDPRVGFWSLRPVSFPLLQPDLPGIDAATAARLNWTEEQREAVATGIGRVNRFKSIAVGYAGWLLLDPSFLREQQQFFLNFADVLSRHGIPQLAASGKVDRHPDVELLTDEQDVACVNALEEFCIRWRLSGVAGPDLPVPLQPGLPVLHLPSVLGHMQHAGAAFYLPDTFPVPSRDDLRDILEESLRGAATPDHLSGWMQIVRGEQSAKNQIERHARLFKIQHYSKAFYSRHSEALKGQQRRFAQALANYFHVGVETVIRDIGHISECLGDDWRSRAN